MFWGEGIFTHNTLLFDCCCYISTLFWKIIKWQKTFDNGWTAVLHYELKTRKKVPFLKARLGTFWVKYVYHSHFRYSCWCVFRWLHILRYLKDWNQYLLKFFLFLKWTFYLVSALAHCAVFWWFLLALELMNQNSRIMNVPNH